MLKVSNEENHTQYKSSTGDKNWDFTAKKSVDLMQAAAYISSRHVKRTEAVQGPNHRTRDRVCPRRVLLYIYARLLPKGCSVASGSYDFLAGD